jgi:hypothetical protein
LSLGVKYLVGLAVAGLLVAAVAWGATKGTARSAASIPAADGSCPNPGRATPVLLVPGIGAKPSEFSASGASSLASTVGRLPDVKISYFDYYPYSLEWVTDAHIGPALGRMISCLADKSAAQGGPGKVVVITHSMGGLALRDAAAEEVTGRPVASRLGLAVTIATPNDGSWVEGDLTSASTDQSGTGAAMMRMLVQQLAAATRVICAGETAGASGPSADPGGTTDPVGQTPDASPVAGLLASCGLLAAPDSPAARAMTPGSPQLAALPPLPQSIPVFAVAGDIDLRVSVAGVNANLPVNLGDLLVQPASALAEAGRSGPGAGSFVDTCDENLRGALSDPSQLGRVSCEHGQLLYARPVIDRVQQAVAAYLASLGRAK